MKRDYSEKIFQQMGLRDIVLKLTQKIEENPMLNQQYDGALKANTLSSLLQVDEAKGERILKFVSYIDELLISEEEKVAYLITFSSLIEDAKLNIEALDDGYIFILTEFFRYRSVQEIKSLILIISIPELVLAVRNKTLDSSMRTEILNYVTNQYINQNITHTNQNEFLMKMITTIQESDYYKLIEIMQS